MLKFRETWAIDIHHLRIHRSGHYHHIDAHLVVPEFWDIGKTHDLTQAYEHRVVEAYHFDGEIIFHIDPCQRKYCAHCQVDDCPIRQVPFRSVRAMSSETLIQGPKY